MNRKNSSNIDSLVLNKKEQFSIIKLFPCDNDSSDEDEFEKLSQDSIDSSELVEDSDNEAEFIHYFCRLNKRLNKIDEKSNEIATA